MIRLSCPGCHAVYPAEDARVDQPGTCPKCQTPLVVAAESTTAPPPLPPPLAAEPGPTVAPVEIAPCPECRARLSVLESELGSRVECPHCKTIFKAVRGGQRPARREDEDRPRRQRDEDDRPRRRRDDEDEDRPRRQARRDDEEDDDRPRRRRDEDDEDVDRPRRRSRRYEEDEDDRPRRRSRREEEDREAAASAVAGPAILMMIVGGLGLAFAAFAILAAILGLRRQPGQPEDLALTTADYIGAFVSLIWAIIVLAGGLKMKSLSGRGSALTAAVVALLPCNALCLLGLPVGIWAILTLNRDDVKKAFD